MRKRHNANERDGEKFEKFGSACHSLISIRSFQSQYANLSLFLLSCQLRK